MPYLTPATLTLLADSEGHAVFADEPFPGRYEPSALDALRGALQRGEPVRRALAALDPLRLELEDPQITASVNTPEQLAEARRILG
jgi:molybdopterin-guanine dinucleotide biosynthesis protein A